MVQWQAGKGQRLRFKSWKRNETAVCFFFARTNFRALDRIGTLYTPIMTWFLTTDLEWVQRISQFFSQAGPQTSC